MKNLKQLNLLLIEDDKTLREELYDTLSIFFKTVYPCENGQIALEKYNNNKIDVVFTDYVMPVMDGYTFSKKIREINKNLPIIFLTNYTDKEKLLKLITLNITEFLIKPINYENLVKSLKELSESIQSNEDEVLIRLNENIIYSKETKSVFVEDKEINLTKNEITFMEILIKNINSTVTFESLSYAFGDDYKSEHAIKNMIYRLNQKIKINFLKNIPGIGYKIEK